MESFKPQPVNNQEQLKKESMGEDGINEKNKIPKLIENAKRELQHQLDLAQSKYENDLKHYPGEQHRAHIDSIRDKRIKQAQESHDDRIKFLNKMSEENLNSAA